ncbi:uncharacterized protein LOC124152177 isoform X1 [Haliotis rufescens]|uniref:uncharacterized protein LOC124152177 isoform X1 n=2 Tax=Haliotis rufescens TaxID=6454 RepID=UPI001EB031A0|nr:uncharacterized protein LOC124152177 isoform X1 [Haliotis rufescens]
MIRPRTLYLPGVMGGKSSRERVPTPPPTEKWGADVTLNWTPEGENDFRRRIAEVTTRDGHVVILFGQTGFGKSSFGNGIRTSIRRERKVSNYFPVGINTHGSYTKALNSDGYCRRYCQDKCTCQPYLWVIDMPGLFNSDAITDESIEKIVTGQVPFYAEVKPTLEAMDSSQILPPQERVKASCVVLVLKAGVAVGDDVKRQIGVLRTLHSRGVLSVHVILTHIDAVEPLLKDSDNIPYVFNSEEVRAAVRFASTETGLPQTCISVVKNYTVENATNTNSSILFLHALENILLAARDTLERDETKNRMRKQLYARGTHPQ